MKLFYAEKRRLLVSLMATALMLFLCGCQDAAEQEDQAAAVKLERVDTPEPSAAEYNYDSGEQPWVLDIEKGTVENTAYRRVAWTGKYLQMAFMSLKSGEEIELELHDDHDQFIRIEQGEARVEMGKTRDNLTFNETVSDDWGIFVPAGFWHKVTNTGTTDLKLYTIYAPPEHPMALVHMTAEDAEEYEH